MELGALEKSIFPELEAYVEQIEAFDTQKIEALKDLAKLRKVSFQQLAIDLAVFPRTNEVGLIFQKRLRTLFLKEQTLSVNIVSVLINIRLPLLM